MNDKPISGVTLNPEQAALIVAASQPVGRMCGIEIRTNAYMPHDMIGYHHPDGTMSIGWLVEPEPEGDEG